MQGANAWIVGTKIGGVRDSTGYTTWPNTGVLNPGSTGHDFPNAPLMVKQELPNTEPAYLDNIVVDRCFLAGGGSFCVNFSAANGNNLAGVTIKDTKIAQRQYGDGLGVDTNGDPTSVGSGYGYYRNSVQSSTWTGNTVYETGVSIPTGTNQAQ
jgi:hypothetical protein